MTHVHQRTGVTLNAFTDGVTHINIYSKAATELGVNLSFFKEASFTHPKYGYFNSLEAFYHWAGTGKCNDNLRGLYGTIARTVGKQYGKVHDPSFHAEINDAVRYKMQQYPELSKKLMECTLPLVHYWVGPDSRVIYPAQHDWIAVIYDNLREHLLCAP